MDIEQLRDYCIAKKGVTEGFPFDSETLVFKVMGKMFALVSLEANPLSMNLKCDPENAIALREEYSCVLPGYHMSKTHWNTIVIDGSVPDSLLRDWIDQSYNLVVAGLPKSARAQIG